jgi:hypothetical protein
MAAACNSMKKKNCFLLIIILTAALLIAIVFWIYAKRIERIDNKIIHSRQSAHFVSSPAGLRHFEFLAYTGFAIHFHFLSGC